MDSFSRVQGFRIQTLIIEAYPLGDLCLGEIWVGLLGFLPRIHTEEVEGGLVGLGCIGVLGFISMHLHRQRHCQHATAQTDTLSACICTDRQIHSQHSPAQTDRHTVGMHLHRQTDAQSACVCTDRQTHSQHASAQTDRHTVSMHLHRHTLSACICTDRQTHSQHASAQADTLSACICTDRHTVKTRCKLRCQKGCINVYTKGFCHHALSQLPSLGTPSDCCRSAISLVTVMSLVTVIKLVTVISLVTAMYRDSNSS